MTKQIFTQSQQPEEEEILPKQEFYNVETTIDNEPLEGELLDEQFEQIVKPKSSGWKTALKLTALLFLGATVAQDVYKRQEASNVLNASSIIMISG